MKWLADPSQRDLAEDAMMPVHSMTETDFFRPKFPGKTGTLSTVASSTREYAAGWVMSPNSVLYPHRPQRFGFDTEADARAVNIDNALTYSLSVPSGPTPVDSSGANITYPVNLPIGAQKTEDMYTRVIQTHVTYKIRVKNYETFPLYLFWYFHFQQMCVGFDSNGTTPLVIDVKDHGMPNKLNPYTQQASRLSKLGLREDEFHAYVVPPGVPTRARTGAEGSGGVQLNPGVLDYVIDVPVTRMMSKLAKVAGDYDYDPLAYSVLTSLLSGGGTDEFTADIPLPFHIVTFITTCDQGYEDLEGTLATDTDDIGDGIGYVSADANAVPWADHITVSVATKSLLHLFDPVVDTITDYYSSVLDQTQAS